MKLLYISSPSFSDCDFPLIKNFQKKGIDITYLILITPFELRSTLIDIKQIYPHTGIFPATVYPEFKRFDKYISSDKIYVCNRHGQSKKTISYWKNLLQLYNFIRQGNFDVIHTDLLFSGDKKFLYKLGKLVTTIHDPFPHSGEDWNYNKNSYMQAINNSAGIVLLNRNQKKEFCQKYGVDEKKILINSLGPYEVINYISNNTTKQKIENNILFFGRIAPYKGIEYLCALVVK